MHRRLSDFGKKMPLGLCSLKHDYSISECNDYFANFFGYASTTALIGLRIDALVVWSHLQKLHDFLSAVKSDCPVENDGWELGFMAGNTERRIRIWGAINDQAIHLIFQSVTQKRIDSLNDLMYINNDMANLHRELTRKQMQLQAAHSRMERDLHMAQIVQKSLLSKIVKTYEKVNLTSTYTPAESVGGDLFDMLVLSDNHVGIFICDVTGHGVASALVMAVIKNMFRTHAPNCKWPHEFLNILNKEFITLFEDTDSDLYATAFYLIINMQSNVMYYANAGHPAPELYHKDSESESLYDPSFPIGMIKHDSYQSKSITIHSHDRLFLYTDGIEPYLSDVRDCTEALKKQTWADIIPFFNTLIEKVDLDSSKQADDVCMLIVEYK